jgi:hypothetical protein
VLLANSRYVFAEPSTTPRWIFHLGLKGVKGLYDKQSVAIEFANEGTILRLAVALKCEVTDLVDFNRRDLQKLIPKRK